MITERHNGTSKKSRQQQRLALIDGSKIITEALVRSGADVFVGYPITPSNLFYKYAGKRFSKFFAAPDEITVLQWMSGFSAAGRLPVTATAFPGLALMTETLNMAYMMELPMVLIVTQRLGPSTGSATTGAQGDLAFLSGIISGGYPIPIFCPASLEDCWNLANSSLQTAIKFRTPVVLLTSKEMIMTNRSFDVSKLKKLEKVDRSVRYFKKPYQPYQAGEDMVPAFIPVGNDDYQVRLNASTHDNAGMIKKANPESLTNTRRLKDKLEKRIGEFTFYELDDDPDADILLISYGITGDSARDAIKTLRSQGKKVSLLIMKTLLPLAPELIRIIHRFKKLVFAEENISGQMKELIFGRIEREHIKYVNKIGSMIAPTEIAEVFD